MPGIKRALVREQEARIRELEAQLASLNRERVQKPAKPKPANTPFATLASATPVRKGKGSKFTITLGDLTFACEDRGRNIYACATNSHGDTRWIVFRPSDPSAMNSGAYLAVVARRYGLIK